MKLWKKAAMAAGILSAALLFTARGSAGDITGALGVAKPDHAVVYVEHVPGRFATGHAEMDQINKVFVPFVLPVVQGATVAFHNGDNLQHNVFGVGADEFNLGTYGMGASRNRVFDKPGEVDILCNVHPEMQAYILVLQNPFFARPNQAGKFHIANVPPGDYVVAAWYQGKSKKQNVKVPAKGSVTANF